jgi:hypothetical protein
MNDFLTIYIVCRSKHHHLGKRNRIRCFQKNLRGVTCAAHRMVDSSDERPAVFWPGAQTSDRGARTPECGRGPGAPRFLRCSETAAVTARPRYKSGTDGQRPVARALRVAAGMPHVRAAPSRAQPHFVSHNARAFGSHSRGVGTAPLGAPPSECRTARQRSIFASFFCRTRS